MLQDKIRSQVAEARRRMFEADMRASFEAYCRENPYTLGRLADGEYIFHLTEEAWCIYRRAVEDTKEKLS